MKIALLIIATEKYTCFLQQLISSADQYFFNNIPNTEIEYIVFSNKLHEVKSLQTKRKIVSIEIDHKPWPFITLERYLVFNSNKTKLTEYDYLYYSDVDMRFVDSVSSEILSERVATQHPGYYGRRGTPETNERSLAYVAPNENMQYFAGGFNGGSSFEFLKMSEKISRNIKSDLQNNIIAVWHDESHMNRYFIDNPPTLVLSPSYCYAESVNIPFKRKLIALNKNHREMRT